MTKTLYGVRGGREGERFPIFHFCFVYFPSPKPKSGSSLTPCLSLPALLPRRIVACPRRRFGSPPLASPIQILILKVNSVSRRRRDKRGEKSALWIQGWNFLLYPSDDFTVGYFESPMYGHPVRPTLRRNKGHWIIAQTAPLSRLAAASWMYAEFIGFPFALPHFPSCFCNGFPFGHGGALAASAEGNSSSLSLFISPFPAL